MFIAAADGGKNSDIDEKIAFQKLKMQQSITFNRTKDTKTQSEIEAALQIADTQSFQWKFKTNPSFTVTCYKSNTFGISIGVPHSVEKNTC